MAERDMEEILDSWLKQVESLADVSISDRAKITGVGAEVFRRDLEAETNKRHRSNHNDKVYGHAADHITMQRSNSEGRRTGVSTAGWENRYHAMNMQRLNDGTRKYTADHFVDNLRKSDAEIEKVLLAESAEYKKLVEKAERKV